LDWQVISSPAEIQSPVSDHFDGRRFINPGGIKAKGLREVLKWMIARKQGEWKEINDRHDKEKPAARVDNGIRITFVNHSTFLIQVDGVNILTDRCMAKEQPGTMGRAPANAGSGN